MDFTSVKSALKSLARREQAPSELRAQASAALESAAPVVDERGDVQTSPEARKVAQGLIGCDRWEGLAVGLLLATEIVNKTGTARPQGVAEFRESLTVCASTHLEHTEPRVRGLVAKLLGALTTTSEDSTAGLALYEERFSQRLLSAIANNFQRTSDTIPDQISGRNDVAVDDTTGWKALETSVLALKAFVHSIGRPFIEKGNWTEDLMEYTCRGASEHVNRHVREASFGLIASVIGAAGSLQGEGAIPMGGKLKAEFSRVIGTGLADNWSQVRFAASVANRALLDALPEEGRDELYPLLLPRMCLNRYYLAEGVKLYSQENWKRFLGANGAEAVARHCGAVAEYYAFTSAADNHVVREAACHSIAELAVKVRHDAMAPHVANLLHALLLCFRDESWPVRDAACVASGRFAGAYPEECRPTLEELYTRWFKHLSEPIWSVREDSAQALREVCGAYGRDAVDRCVKWVRENLLLAKDQPAQTREEYKATHNDAAAHTDNQRYSCGSLAPKLKKGGCSDCEVTRPSMPWEYTDGAIYLLGQLCTVAPEDAVTLFEGAAEAAQLTHFPQADTIRETLWKLLPDMAEAIGKRTFKRHMDIFLEPLIETLVRPGTHQLASHAAGGCVRRLSKFIGPEIFRGRLTEDQRCVVDSSPFVGGALVDNLPSCGAGDFGAAQGMAPWATGSR
jgi:hypothetical protein